MNVSEHQSSPHCDSKHALVAETELQPQQEPQTQLLSKDEFQQQQLKIEKLNRTALELFSMKRFQAALFHFNEAFQTIVPLGDQLMLLEQEDCATAASVVWGFPDFTNAAGMMFARHIQGIRAKARILPLLQDCLMLPLSVETSTGERHEPLCLGDIQDWILLSSRTIMFNGALAHYQLGQFQKAEELLLFATALDEDGNAHVEAKSGYVCPMTPRERRLKSVLVPIYHLMGKLLGAAPLSQNETNESRTSSEPPTRIEEAVDSFDRAIHLAASLLGGMHMTVASLYTSLGQMLLQQGYVRGATYAFNAVNEIYDRPRISISNRGAAVSFDEVNFEELSDDEISALLLQDGCGVASPAA